MGLSQGYGPADDTESIAAIHAALDTGVTLLDTAISYGQGHNEALVGRAIASKSVVPANGWVGDRQSFAVPVTTRPVF